MKKFIPIIFFGLLVALLGFGLTNDPREVPSPYIGKQRPDFNLPSLFNPEQRVSAEMMNGKVWLLNIWAEWCPSCWQEHRYLVHLKDVEKLKIIGLDWKDEPEKAKRMIGKMGNPFYAIANDTEGDISIDWGVTGAPETFIIDKKGVVRWKHAGPIDPEIWNNDMKQLIDKLEKE